MFEHMEHRWGRRIAVEIPIRVSAANPSPAKQAYLVNVSLSGALVKADFKLRLLSRVRIVLGPSLDPASTAVSIDAYVARNHPLGIGVEWCEFASRPVTELLRDAEAQSAEHSRRGLSLKPCPERLSLTG